jgi:hypothetical protein
VSYDISKKKWRFSEKSLFETFVDISKTANQNMLMSEQHLMVIVSA